MAEILSFFQKRQKLLALAASIYVFSLVLLHWQLSSTHVWLIAAFFSIIMNFSYVLEAYSRKACITIETIVASVLILASVLGVFLSPIFIITAIIGHGVWDIAKHNGMGVPFFSWYTLSCFMIDLIYGVALIFFWINIG